MYETNFRTPTYYAAHVQIVGAILSNENDQRDFLSIRRKSKLLAVRDQVIARYFKFYFHFEGVLLVR
jgi:hypothetical protein